jgi:hypothetical protein
MKWHKVRFHSLDFFFKWMEWYGIRCSSYFISYHVFFLFSFYPIQCFLFIFISSNLKGIQWNETYKLNNYYFTFFYYGLLFLLLPCFKIREKLVLKCYKFISFCSLLKWCSDNFVFSHHWISKRWNEICVPFHPAPLHSIMFHFAPFCFVPSIQTEP